MDDGAEFTAGRGDITPLPATTPGIADDELVVAIGWSGAGNYARLPGLAGGTQLR